MRGIYVSSVDRALRLIMFTVPIFVFLATTVMASPPGAPIEYQPMTSHGQHVKTGQTAPLPIDLLIKLPDKARSSMELRPVTGGNLEILSDGVAIGTITRRGVPVTLRPESFGPGFARLGIVRFYVTGDSLPGEGQAVEKQSYVSLDQHP